MIRFSYLCRWLALIFYHILLTFDPESAVILYYCKKNGPYWSNYFRAVQDNYYLDMENARLVWCNNSKVVTMRWHSSFAITLSFLLYTIFSIKETFAWEKYSQSDVLYSRHITQRNHLTESVICHLCISWALLSWVFNIQSLK